MQWLRDAQHFHLRLESLYPALWETCEEFGESYPFQTLKSMVNLSTLNTSFSGSPLIENSFSGWRLPWATSKREAKKLWWRLRRKVLVLLNSGKQEKGDRNQTTASKFCQSRSFIILTHFQLKNIDLASRINRWQLSLQMNLKKWDLKIEFSFWHFLKIRGSSILYETWFSHASPSPLSLSQFALDVVSFCSCYCLWLYVHKCIFNIFQSNLHL